MLHVRHHYRLLFSLPLLAMLVGCVSPSSFPPLASFEKSVIYQPVRYPSGDWNPDGLVFQDAWFESDDGTKLHGWFVPHKNPVAVALMFHGNAGNVSHRAETLRILNQRHRLSIMTFDYRGYGRSDGKPDEKGILADARAARKWLAKTTNLPESEIVLMGRSLGGAVAVDLAASDGAKGLVLASTFTSLPEVGGHHFRYLPASFLMTQRLDSLAKISNYRGPLLQSHGDADQVIPFDMGKRLFDKANEPKRFIAIPNGGHNDPQSEEYRIAFDEFLSEMI